MSIPNIGTPFNPWHGACGFWPEDIVDRQRDLGDGPKRVYRRLKRFAGVNGSCFRSQEILAAELGKGERQVRRDLAELETNSFPSTACQQVLSVAFSERLKEQVGRVLEGFKGQIVW